MKRLAFVIPVLFLIGVAALFYVGLESGPPELLPSPLVGKPAPDFNFAALDANARGFAHSDLVGHPTIVNFWASWCAPCRIEHPMLQALAADRRIALYGIVYKDRPNLARGFLDELGNPFARIGTDPAGRAGIDWGITGVPETFVIDARGIVRAHVSGPLTPEIVEKTILPALEASRP